MTVKKYFITIAAVFFCFAIIDFLFDSLLLVKINNSLSNVWRPQMIFWLEPVLYLVSTLLFVFIFARIYKGKGITEGIFYGFLIGILMAGYSSFKQYALYPIPFKIAVIWFIEGLIQYTIAGIIMSSIAGSGTLRQQ